MMHRRQESPAAPSCTALTLGRRLRLIRIEIYGEDDVITLVRSVGLPAQTWLNYEAGVTIPGSVLLEFLDTTAAEPRWLLTGLGPRYRPGGGTPGMTS